ncbi:MULTISPECIES: OPT/YSL family transporter [unclassified Streptomyces]|uniref:OPT/YSL family transporter n=1 Tax=unclassified Streptomyces TaxID=2593676 RepID=UPI000DBA821C|nr:OPT/YSL family transporter [Streptomyces sp. PsTaAH-137]MYT73605.1 OPT family oligopeptide transporter [Streptomyces sp. SID8367]RAJ85142.1 putative oligopeptide transporter (OPT) family protein [Streptomyces sp. PsTaAH-137]
MSHHTSPSATAPPPADSGPGVTTSGSGHPRVTEPVVFIVLAVLSVVGAVIGADLVAKLGISANTSVVGALIAMLIGRIPLAGLRSMRSVHRQNLAQSAISAATFASANALLTSIAVPYVFGRKDLVWPMLIGSFAGLLIDTWVLYRSFGSRLLPADAAWPPGQAAAETIKAGDKGGKRALVLGAGTLVGLGGTLFSLPLSAAGVAFLGNVWALLMFGVGLGLREFSPDLFHTDLGAGYVPHGVMVGAGVVALGQAVFMLVRRRPARQEQPAAGPAPSDRDETTAYTVDEKALRRSLVRGYALFVAGAVLLAVLGGLIGDMSPLGLLGWVLFAAFAALVHELIVGLAAMQSGWFPSFAVTLIFLVLGLLSGIPSVPLALLVGYVSATGPAFADMGYDLKAGWLLRRDHRPWDPYEREGRREQFRAALIGFAAALAVVAVLWQSYFKQGLIPPVAKVYADTVKNGLGEPGVLRTLLIWAVPGALIQLIGGTRRQMGVMLATGLLILTPNACWMVLAALAVRVGYRKWRGPRADEELNLVGAGLIAGSSLGDSAQIIKAS